MTGRGRRRYDRRMHAMPPMPLLKRVQPSVWVALAWAAGAVFTFLVRLRLPGEDEPAVLAGS